MVVGDVERVGGREGDRVGGQEQGRGDGTDVAGNCRVGRVEDKVLDYSALAGMIGDIEIGFVAVVRRPDVKPKRVEIMIFWVVGECDSCWEVVSGIKPECPVGLRIMERPHDGVPGLAPRVAAQDEVAVDKRPFTVMHVPEGGVLAVLESF